MIDQIIKELNQSICGCYPSGKLYGLTSLMRRDNYTIPAEINFEGEGIPITPDNTIPMIVYHRLNSIASTQANTTPNYGDKVSNFNNAFSLSAFVYFDRSQLKKSVDDIYFSIQAAISRISQNLRQPVVQYQVQVNGAIFNDLQVWNNEFTSNTTYKLPTNANFIQINYSVIAVFNTNCFKCDC